jgi:hypothetical protein
MSLTRTIPTAVVTLTLTALLGAGCSDNAETSDGPSAGVLETTTQSTPAQEASRSPAPDEAGEPAETQENLMNIQITIGDQTFSATLQDSPATRDLVSQLPVTVEMIDHGGVEKTGPLPGPLSLEGQPEGADPDIGDVGYYAPGNDLVLYYGDQSYFPGIVVLGRMDGDAAERIARLVGPVTVTVDPQ